MTGFTLAAADALVDATMAAGGRLGLAPLAVAVLDPGGHVVVAKRQDGAGLFRIDLAIGKAPGALGMGHGTRALAKMAEAAPMFFTGAMAATGSILPSPGGILLSSADGVALGAIGVSGDRGDRDEAAALAAIEPAGLNASL